MKLWMVVLLTGITIIGCRQSHFQRRLSGADEVVIQFYKDNTTDSVYKIVHTNNPDGVMQLIGYLTDEAATGAACGQDGQMIFRKSKTAIDTVRFSLTGCRQFEYEEAGQFKRTKLSNEAFDFLGALKLKEDLTPGPSPAEP